LKKKLQNDSFYCVFFVKIARLIQNPYSMLKLAKFCGGKFRSENYVGSNVKMGKMGGLGKGKIGTVTLRDILDILCRRQRKEGKSSGWSGD